MYPSQWLATLKGKVTDRMTDRERQIAETFPKELYEESRAGRGFLFPVSGEERRPIPGFMAREAPLASTSDGRALFVTPGEVPAKSRTVTGTATTM